MLLINLCQISYNLQVKYINQLLEHLKEEVPIYHLQLRSKCSKRIRYLLCAIDLFSKYAWVVPLKDKKRVTIINPFKIILKRTKRKTNKIWVDQGSEFYNSSFKKWLK